MVSDVRMKQMTNTGNDWILTLNPKTEEKYNHNEKKFGHEKF